MSGNKLDNFDDLLKTKLGDHLLKPEKDLMPGIMKEIDSSSGGSTLGFYKFWVLGIVGLLFLGGLGYSLLGDSGVNSGRQNPSSDQGLVIDDAEMDRDENVDGPVTKAVESSIASSKSNVIKEKVISDISSAGHEASENSLTDVNLESSVAAQEITGEGKEIKAEPKKLSATVKPRVTKKKNFNGSISTSSNGQDDKENKVVSHEVEESSPDQFLADVPESKVGSNESQITKEGIDKVKREEVGIIESSEFSNGNNFVTVNNTNESQSLGSTKLPDVNAAAETKVTNESLDIKKEQVLDQVDTDLTTSSDQNSLVSMDNNTMVAGQIESPNEGMTPSEDLKIEILPTPSNWSFDFLGGPSYNYRMLDFENNRELEDHKNQYESSIMTYTYAARFRRKFKNKWAANVGFMYLHMGEIYDFSNASASHKATNEYKYFSVPVGLEYKVADIKKVDVMTGIGAQINFLKEGVSSWLDPESLDAQTHSHEDSSSPFNETTMAWNAKVGIRYELSPKLDLIIEEQGLLFNNSVYKKETGLMQREYSLKTYVGIGIKF